MPPKCTICIHEQVDQIDSEIQKGVSFRNIAKQFELPDHLAVYRHADNHLNLDLKAVIAEARVKRAVNVYEEFEEQLVYIKAVRDTALRYLEDPDDPFQLFLGPQAHEVTVMYADFNDMEVDEKGKSKPKKKKAKLNQLLAELANVGIEANRVDMKYIDIRKFSLEAVSVCDVAIDKFARMGGDYQRDRKNDKDPSVLAERLVEFLLQKGWERPVAEDYAKKKYQLMPA